MKKAYLRTIEAIIAVVLIFIFIVTVLPREKQEIRVPKGIETVQDKIITKIQDNEALRHNVLNYDVSSPGQDRDDLNTSISNMVSGYNINYEFTVCRFSDFVCNPDMSVLPEGKDIYARSAMIASTTDKKIFRLYLWYEI